MKEVENVLRILEETRKSIENCDSARIYNLSNQTINTASLTKDPDNIAVAVFVYALSKIVGCQEDHKFKGVERLRKNIPKQLDYLIKDIKKGDEIRFRKDLHDIRKEITKVSGKLKEYIKFVFRKAQVNKATKIYEHGISQELTAKLLGVTSWEIQEYAGPKGVSDIPLGKTLDTKTRIKVVESFFK
jgi:hypothetical protein